MVSIKFTPKAEEHVKQLEPIVQKRIEKKFREVREATSGLEVDPERYIKRLQGYDYHRLRVGDYRAIIKWKRQSDVFVVVAVGHRKTVYDREL